VWVFLRVVWLHVCVCWDRMPGKPFIYLSVVTGIVVPLAFLGATFAASGFSYALGPTCFIKHEHSFALFWGWFAGFACATLALQLGTTGYSVVVYVMSHRMRKSSARSVETTSSSWGSLRRQRQDREKEVDERAAAAIHRADRWVGIRRTLVMQWRIIVLALALVIEGLYFTSLGWASETKSSAPANEKEAMRFGNCLLFSGGDRTKCWQFAEYFVINKNATLASLAVMSVCYSPPPPIFGSVSCVPR
jgi:hypothetical protein